MYLVPLLPYFLHLPWFTIATMATDRFILQHWFMIIRKNDKVIKVCLVPHLGIKLFPSIFKSVCKINSVLNQLKKYLWMSGNLRGLFSCLQLLQKTRNVFPISALAFIVLIRKIIMCLYYFFYFTTFRLGQKLGLFFLRNWRQEKILLRFPDFYVFIQFVRPHHI